ncbi:toll/interleukin-1 receptor domain-containing protein [Paludibacter sp.]|uniref:toll/interleukin-1 receptor domain-containing protein n=1 Tax=Paludibacter sp. TaxID=1898105 RepID=UPI001355D3AB|nr:toll/interleukin-1 receptor domain-containing protein [Paludibacter sp.]MTK53114.1 toll/interleukin-1 receptor domain-containing protein [Paludibacter sp.]
MNQNFDIFISYRRQGGGFETANLIHDRLTQAGYKVFMDIENLRSGKFNEQIYNQIDYCKDFIVVLGENSLERCINDDDWVRLEVAHAIKTNKNIIPIFLRNFNRSTIPLPADISELLNYEGIEASQELFGAFLVKLRSMLVSKRHFTLPRFRKQLLFTTVPILLLTAALLFIHFYKKHGEYIQLEQVCKEVVSEMAVGFGKGNILLSTIDEANIEWRKFHAEYVKSNDRLYKNRLKSELITFIDFKLKQISDTANNTLIKLTPAHEELLAKYSISTEDIKGAKMMFDTDLEQTKEYLMKMKYWLSVPDMSWPLQLDESMDILASMDREMINCGIFSFNELILEMPVNVRDVYAKFAPNLTKYTYEMDYSKTRTELEAMQAKSMKKCEELLSKYSVIIGDENKIVSWMSNQLDSLKHRKKIIPVTVIKSPKIDSLKKVVEGKKQALFQKKNELDNKKQELRESYKRILAKCSFGKNEEQGMMWGKIIHLAQFGYSQVLAENKCKVETERLKKEASKAGQDPNTVEPITATISAREVFTEVQKRLDIYQGYNKETDPNVKVYIPAVKRYYQLVGEHKLEPTGILMIGTDNNIPHPVLKIGDVIIERKGRAIDRIETYAKLKEMPSPNVLKIIRIAGGKLSVLTKTISPDCKVLVGMMNLWEEN